MAQLIIAAAGAAIGGAIAPGIVAFGMTGASIGWAAGSLVGSMFAPTQKGYGPRLGDLRVGGSAYGAVAPWVAGSPRVAGQVIWASTKRELATTVEEGKGGGGSEYTTYTYEVDLWLLLAENSVPGVSRVWSNGELVYNLRGDADVDTVTASEATPAWTRITYYDGNASQTPDATYEAAVTTALAPAYRTRSTVFIEGLQLGGSGQLPNLTFELSEGVPTVNVGAEFSVASGTKILVSEVSDDYIMCLYTDGAADLRAQLLSVSGTSLVYQSGSNLSASTALLGMCPLSDGRALFSYRYGGNTYVNVIGHTGATIDLGTEVLVGTWTGECHVSELELGRALMIGDGSTLKARVVNISGLNVTSVGTAYSSGSAISQRKAVAGLTSSTAIVGFNATPGYEVKSVGLSIAGDVVTWGTPVTVDTPAGGSAGGLSLSKSSTTSALLTYGKYSGSDWEVYSSVVTASSAAAPTVLSYSTGTGSTDVVLGADYRRAVWVNDTGTSEGEASFLTSSGALTTGNTATVTAATFSQSVSGIAALSAWTAVYAYKRDSSLYARLVILSEE